MPSINEDNDDPYRESSDEDFNPNNAPADEPSSSEEEDHAIVKPAQRRRKRKTQVDEELDSGDEVTIQAARETRAKKKKRKKRNKDDSDDDLIVSDDDGGEGGLIKTRSQRIQEKKERKPLARTDGATIDVEAVWAQMTAAPLRPLQTPIPQPQDTSIGQTMELPMPPEEEEQVTVKKVYTFAGQDTTEEKQIPQSHLDKYLKDGWKTLDLPEAPKDREDEPTSATQKSPTSRTRRPLYRPTRFDPNPTGIVRALPPEDQLFFPRKTAPIITTQETFPPQPGQSTIPGQAQKLNVVDKSRMDWSGFVAKEGIAEELDTHGRTKEAYLGRMDFLAEVEARREEERRNFRVQAANAKAS